MDVSSLRLLDVAVDPSAPTSLMDMDGDRRLERGVKFPRSAFAGLPAGENVVCLTGRTTAGIAVAGCGVLRVKGEGTSVNKSSAAWSQGPTLKARNGRIAFEVAQPTQATLDVLDVQGRVVARLFRGVAMPGESVFAWPAGSRSVPAGIYFGRVRTANAEAVVRLAVVK